jgi:hypothetical protein
MTITRKLFSVAALSALLGLVSCNKDDEKSNSQLSKNDAKQAIATFNSSASSDLQGLADADGLKAVQDFFQLVDTDDPFGRVSTDHKKVRAFFQKKGKDFRNVFVPLKSSSARTQGDQPYNYNESKGVYTWNPSLEQFEKTGSSDIVKIQFPTEGSATNNAELQLTAYSEKAVYDPDFDETHYEPTVLKASLFVNSVKVSYLDLAVNWDEKGFPLTASITFNVTPYTATVSFDVSNSTSSSLKFSLLKDQQTLIATNVTVKYKDSSKSEESLKSVEGFVQFKNMKLQGTVDAEAANQQQVDWNKIINVDLYSDGKKIGDVVFVEENSEYVAYLQYADGTKEKLETVLQPVVDEINKLADDLNTNG